MILSGPEHKDKKEPESLVSGTSMSYLNGRSLPSSALQLLRSVALAPAGVIFYMKPDF